MQATMVAVCRVLPTEARLFYSSCDRATSVAVSKYVTEQVTPGLLQREVARIRGMDVGDTLKVATGHGGREVTACYTQDEIQIEMVSRLQPYDPCSSHWLQTPRSSSFQHPIRSAQ